MVNEYDYGRQKLWKAVCVLVGDGAMRDRLGFARGLLEKRIFAAA